MSISVRASWNGYSSIVIKIHWDLTDSVKLFVEPL